MTRRSTYGIDAMKIKTPRDRKKENSDYHAGRGMIFQFTERELQPETIAALIRNLDETGWHPSDTRRARLADLYQSLMGAAP